MWHDIAIWKIVVLAYLIFVLVLTLLKTMTINKNTFGIILSAILILVAGGLVYYYVLPDGASAIKTILKLVLIVVVPLGTVIIILPDIRERLYKEKDKEEDEIVSSSAQTKENIVDAAITLSNRKIGAIITIENHKSLDKYAEKAIKMNSAVTKELLLNIFTPLTPLHDGAVIIRNDQILCAGAYFPISKNDSFDKTMGSRHRAAIGISEETDALTIVVSEETGDISIAFEGMLMKMSDRDKLLEYLNILMK